MPLARGTKNAFHPRFFSTLASREDWTFRCLDEVELDFLPSFGRLVTWAVDDEEGRGDGEGDGEKMRGWCRASMLSIVLKR